jgi:chaperonin GroEL
MSVSYHKVKSVPKVVSVESTGLSKKVLETMRVISEVVGATLGPGGRPVLIERQEYGVPNIVTKDGVTVFRSLGFEDSTTHSIMEAARDASVRTANEAGDGTTTATVLSYSIMENMSKYCASNPKVSPQRVTRDISRVFSQHIEPMLAETSKKVSFDDEKGRDLLLKVAALSANGDYELAKRVIECFDLVGDAGNVTIVEENGHSAYEVERISGYPINTGYEDGCGRYYPQFINDKDTNQVKMEKPVFVLNFGKINDIQSLLPLLNKINDAWEQRTISHNIVLVSTGFSDTVIGHLAINFPVAETLNVLPVVVPMSPSPTGQLDFLEDLAAITGGKVFSNLGTSLETAKVSELGYLESGSLEVGRYRANVIGHKDDILIMERVALLEKRLKNVGSQLDAIILQERIGKVSGGIAKLKVIGPSTGEVKERRDRAEDAICAVRGALKSGYLPGGGWALLRAWHVASGMDSHVKEVLCPSLLAPVQRLLSNAGLNESESSHVIKTLLTNAEGKSESPLIYDALAQEFGRPEESGILDSAPAVIEALRNSISIATLLGTLGGTVVYPRDKEFERREAKEAHDYLRNAGESHPASE